MKQIILEQNHLGELGIVVRFGSRDYVISAIGFPDVFIEELREILENHLDSYIILNVTETYKEQIKAAIEMLKNAEMNNHNTPEKMKEMQRGYFFTKKPPKLKLYR